MASATPAPRSASSSSPTAESYIGSLISLTSKSDIRYEGLLIQIDSTESSIGLRNVRSFGTEGRKKDGPQVPPSDKMYEFIVFRGSDIKDIQVKCCAPVQMAPPVFTDPAIIQSQYQSVNPSPTVQPVGGGSIPDLSVHSSQTGLARPPFQNNPPLYPPVGNVAPWASSPSLPTVNGSGVAPMYFPGYYAPSNMFQAQQQSLLRPQPNLPMTASMQQTPQQSAANPALPIGVSNVATSELTMSPSALLPIPSFHSSSFPAPHSLLSTNSLNLQPPMLPPQPSTGVPEPSANSVPIMGSAQPSPLISMDKPATHLPISEKAVAVHSSITGIPSSAPSEGQMPNLITPGQLMQPGPTAVSSAQTPPQMSQKKGELAQKSSELASSQTRVAPEAQGPLIQHTVVSTVQVSKKTYQNGGDSVLGSSSEVLPSKLAPEAQGPLLPLPSPVEHKHPGARQYSHQRYNNRGGPQRGRGNRMSRPVARFTEDFDFSAMNERFNKDEVWGDLGKTSKAEEDEDESQDDVDVGSSKSGSKANYVKDDFFDSLTPDSLNRGPQNGRTNFSQQWRKDSETFGYVPRHMGGRGQGRGGGRPGGGGYYGRGNGHSRGGRSQSYPGRGQSYPGRGS